MKKLRIVSLILSLALLITSMPFVIFAEGESASASLDEFPVCDNTDLGSVSVGYGGTQKIMSAADATAAGAPQGEDYVLSITNSQNVGFNLDLRKSATNNVKISDVESVTFKIWVSTEIYEFRLRTKNGSSWQKQIKITPTSGEWIDVEITDMSIFADDGNGYFSPFTVGFRGNADPSAKVYVDSITVKVKDSVAGKVEIPYTAENALSIYGYSEMEMYNAVNAAIAGVPAGFEGDYVMKLTNKTNLSVMLDLRQTVCKGIKMEDVESITFRVWIPTKMDLRIRSVSGEWAVNTAYNAGAWRELTVTDMSKFVDDGEGYFSPFSFTFRDTANTAQDWTVYFDGVTVKLKEIVEEPTETETEATTETEAPIAPDPLYYDFDDGMGKEEIPYGERATGGDWVGYQNFRMMNEEQAKYALVPEGYSGWVLALDSVSGGSISIGLDFTHIKVADIESITIRVWCPQKTANNGVRITNSSANSWIMLGEHGGVEQWTEIVLAENQNFNTSVKNFTVFDDGNGYCKAVNLWFRYAVGTAYIDHISIKLRDPDVEPPVITYNGETVIETREGRDFVIDASAHDDYYDVDIPLEYIWSEGALDQDGKLVKGTHTCTIRATDEAGNYSERSLTVNVGERDVEAPTFDWIPEELDFFAMEGMLPLIEVNAADNFDEVGVVFTWSEGALDASGRLTAGEHTLTVSATDLSGNRSEFVITFTVISTRPNVGDVVQDS